MHPYYVDQYITYYHLCVCMSLDTCHLYTLLTHAYVTLITVTEGDRWQVYVGGGVHASGGALSPPDQGGYG